MEYSTLPDSGHASVLLRELRRDDVSAWYRYLSLPLVYQHTSWNVQSPDDLIPNIEAQAVATPHSALRFAITLKGSDELIGTAGFHTVSALNHTAEIAYDLTPALWGQGVASAVCASLARWSFEHVGLVRVQATVLESNLRSAAVLARCGFEREGLLRHYRMVRGSPGNFWMYSKLPD